MGALTEPAAFFFLHTKIFNAYDHNGELAEIKPLSAFPFFRLEFLHQKSTKQKFFCFIMDEAALSLGLLASSRKINPPSSHERNDAQNDE